MAAVPVPPPTSWMSRSKTEDDSFENDDCQLRQNPDLDPRTRPSRSESWEISQCDEKWSLVESIPSSSSSGDHPTISPEAIASWREQIESLSDEQRRSFISMMPAGGLQKYVAAIETVILDRVKSSRALRVSRWIRPLVRFAELSTSVTAILRDFSPPAALVLGGVIFIFSMSKKYADYHESLIQSFTPILRNLEILEKYPPVFADSAEIRVALVEVYGDILRFCTIASKPFIDGRGKPMRSAMLFLGSQWKSYEDGFGQVEKSISHHLEVFDRIVPLALGKLSNHVRKTQIESLKIQERTYDALQSGEQRRLLKESERISKELDKERELRRCIILGKMPRITFRGVQDEKLDHNLAGTGQWILNHDTYRSWKLQQHGGLLWVSGKQGSGKSQLAARVIQDLERFCRTTNSATFSNDVFALAFLYCQSQADEPEGMTNLVGSILRQLYRHLPNDQDVDFIRDLCLKDRVDTLARDDMRDGAKAILSRFNRTFIVVDGLDRCSVWNEADFEKFCAFVASLADFGGATVDSSTAAHVVIFSRPGYPQIADSLVDCARIQVDDGANDQDIDHFIIERTRNLTTEGFYLRGIQENLRSRAEGFFLWVSLVMDAIKKERSSNKMAKAVDTIPRALRGIYSRALSRILTQQDSSRDLALRSMLWVANSERQLTTVELLEALAIEPQMTTIDAGDRLDESTPLGPETADLLVSQGGYFKLLHSSLGEFLTSGSGPKCPKLEGFRRLQSQAQELLAMSCLTYLQLDAFRVGPAPSALHLDRLITEYPLLQYASNHWGNHLRRGRCGGMPELKQHACQFLRSTGPRELSMQVMLPDFAPKRAFLEPARTSPLHLIAMFGLKELISSFSDDELETGAADHYGFFPLDYAIVNKQKDMCDWILERQVARFHNNNNTQGHDGRWQVQSRCALVCLAARYDWGEAISTLLTLGHDKDEKDADLATALHIAAATGSGSALKTLLVAGANPDALDANGLTAIMFAAKDKDLLMVKLLLHYGANPNIQGQNGITALHYAAEHDSIEMAYALLQAGAAMLAMSGAQTPLHTAAAKESTGVLQLFCEKKLGLEDSTEEGWTSLFVAAVSRSVATVEILLRYGARVEHRDNKSRTALHLAAQSGNAECIQALLQHGIDFDARDENGATALHLAAGGGKVEFGTILMTEASTLDVYCRDKVGQTALHYAASQGCTELVRHFLSHGCMPDNLADHHGDWPIHLAARNGRLECLAILVTLNEADLPGQNGNTPLHMVARQGSLSAAQSLLMHGSSIDATNAPEFLETALHHAIMGNKTAMAELLLDNGADPDKATTLGYSPLHLAVETGNKELVSSLLDRGCDPRHRSKMGHTPVYRAILTQGVELIDLFLSRGFDSAAHTSPSGVTCALAAVCGGNLNAWDWIISRNLDAGFAIDNYGNDALVLAAMFGRVEMIGPLLKMGSSPNGPNEADGPPIISATIRGDNRFVQALILNGAEVDKPGFCGHTALHWAAINGYPGVMSSLVQAGASPFAEDDLGMIPADYATVRPNTLRILQKHPGYQYGPLTTRRFSKQSLHRFVNKSAGELAKPPGRTSSSRRSDWLRPNKLVSLIFALKFLGQYTEAASCAADSDYCSRCGMCAAIISGHGHICTACTDVELCHPCWEMYELDGAKPRQVLEKLESDARAVHVVFKQVRHRGGLVLGQILSLSAGFRDWVEEKAAQYASWEAVYNTAGQFKQGNLRGWKFVNLMRRALQVHGQAQRMARGGQLGPEDAWVDITRDLRQFYNEPFAPDAELKNFTCEDHPYFDFRPVEQLDNTEKELFDSDGKLKPAFFETLERKNSSQNVRDVEPGPAEVKNKTGVLESALGSLAHSSKHEASSSPPVQSLNTSDGKINRLSQLYIDLKQKCQNTDGELLEIAWQLAQAITVGRVGFPSLGKLLDDAYVQSESGEDPTVQQLRRSIRDQESQPHVEPPVRQGESVSKFLSCLRHGEKLF